MSIIDVITVQAGQPREGFDEFVGVPNFDAPFVDADANTPAFEAAGQAVT